MFDYNWEMLPRDIEDLNLEAFDPTSEPSLRTYGWRGIDGVLLGDDDAWTSPQLKKPPALAERDFG
jgi:hypothetical protein